MADLTVLNYKESLVRAEHFRNFSTHAPFVPLPPNFRLFSFFLSFFRRRRGSKLRCVKGTRKVVYSFLWMKRQLGRRNIDNFSPVEKIFARFPTKLSAQRSYSSRGCKSVQALTFNPFEKWYTVSIYY